MALEELLAAITAEGEAAVGRVEETSAADAERLVAEARVRVEQARVEALDAAERRLAGMREAALTAARREATAELLRIRRSLLDRILARAAERLPEALSDERYLRGAMAEVVDALGYLADGEGDGGVVRCSPALTVRLSEALALAGPARGRPVRVEADAGIGTGFVVRSGDGVVEVDGTLEARLARLRAALAIEVFAALEAERE